MKKQNEKIKEKGNSALAEYMPMIEAANGLTLAQVCSIAGVEPYTVQNWVKRGFVPHPESKRYFSRQLARILLIASLKDGMKIDDIGLLMSAVNGSADDESDDIVTEEKLYDYYIETVEKIRGVSGRYSENADRIIAQVTADYEPRRENAVDTLRRALKIMTYAHISGYYRQLSEGILSGIKNY